MSRYLYIYIYIYLYHKSVTIYLIPYKNHRFVTVITELPVIIDFPVVTGKLPVVTCKLPVATVKLPVATGKLAVVTGKWAVATGKLAVATCNLLDHCPHRNQYLSTYDLCLVYIPHFRIFGLSQDISTELGMLEFTQPVQIVFYDTFFVECSKPYL